MGRINIRGGSPLRIDFEVDTGKPAPNDTESAPKDFEVRLVKKGNTYHVVREVNGKDEELKTADNAAANMKGNAVNKQHVQVDYDE